MLNKKHGLLCAHIQFANNTSAYDYSPSLLYRKSRELDGTKIVPGLIPSVCVLEVM